MFPMGKTLHSGQRLRHGFIFVSCHHYSSNANESHLQLAQYAGKENSSVKEQRKPEAC